MDIFLILQYLVTIIILIFAVLVAANILGFFSSTSSTRSAPRKSNYNFPDRFETLEELQQELRSVGLESSNLIIGIDYTKSNVSQGSKTFYGQSLHATNYVVARRQILNPYQQVISIIGKTLQPFDDDNIIPTFGFGKNKFSCIYFYYFFCSL